MLGPFNAPTARETFVICHLRWLAPPLQRPHLLPSWSRLQNQLCHMAAGSGQPIRSVAPRAYKADLHKTSAGRSLGGYRCAVHAMRSASISHKYSNNHSVLVCWCSTSVPAEPWCVSHCTFWKEISRALLVTTSCNGCLLDKGIQISSFPGSLPNV